MVTSNGVKPSNEQFRTIFDGAASSYDEVANPYTRARRIEFILAHAVGTCLEVGAGTGEITRALSARHEARATDISPKMVEEMRRKGLSATVCDAEQLPFPDGSFDTVIAAEVIYYLDHPERFFAEAHRVLSPRGRLLIVSATQIATFYDVARGMLRFFGFGGTYFDDSMHRFPGIGELRSLIRKSGFTITAEKRFVIIPSALFSVANNFFEQTPLKHVAAFVGFSATRG